MVLTQRMAAAQLWLLGVFGLELVSDAVQQGDIALLWILLQRGDEGPRHGARGLTSYRCVLSTVQKVSVCFEGMQMAKNVTYDV